MLFRGTLFRGIVSRLKSTNILPTKKRGSRALRFCLPALLLVCASGYTLAEEDSAAVANAYFWENWNDYIRELISEIAEENSGIDPWEPMNRKIFAFNDVADRYVLTPVAKSYQWVTPNVVEKGISNVFSNLFEVTTIVNDLLQFKFAQAGADTGRFLINSTVGLLGIFDVASPLGLLQNTEDFGQTLGYWGVGPGPYIVVPILGSYNLRDSLGGYTDTYTDYFGQIDHVPTRNSTWVLDKVHDRAALFAAEELISGDRYTFIRDAYLQRREFLVNDGVLHDDFGDEDWDDDDWGE